MERIEHRSIGLFAQQRSAFADHAEASLRIYREGGSLPDQRVDGDARLREAHNAITAALAEGVDADQLTEIQLELAKGDLPNSTHVIAKSRWVLLVANYERRVALEAQRDALTAQIDASDWWELWARFTRWRINRTLAQANGIDELSSKKEELAKLHTSTQDLVAGDRPYEEMLLDIEEMLAGGGPGNRDHHLKEIRRVIREIVAIEKRLGAAPSKEYLQQIGAEIIRDLRAAPVLLDGKTAQRVQKRYNEQLSWAMDDIWRGLESQVNWTAIRRVAVKQASDGSVYATKTVMKPLFDHMVPSMSKKRFPQEPVNAWKETHQIIGKPKSKTKGYRIAAFLTDGAARVAFDRMNLQGKVHLSSLLTPAWFLTPDSKLLQGQKRRFAAKYGNNLIHTNVPVNWRGWISWWVSDPINQEAFGKYEDRPLLQDIRSLWGCWIDWNQFEVAGKLSLLNKQQDVVEVWHCMSTKDRSSEKDAAAQHYIDEHYASGGIVKDSAEQRHRLAINRRHTALIALSNPQRNTGFAGTKMRIWDGINRYRAGFDADYVEQQVQIAEDRGKRYRELTGVDELGERRAKAIEAEINALRETDVRGLRAHLRALAEEKARLFRPKTSVKA